MMLAAPRPDLTERSEDFQARTELSWLEAEGYNDQQKEDWQGLAAVVVRAKILLNGVSTPAYFNEMSLSSAMAYARLGRFPEAEAELARVSADADRSQTLRLRALISDLKGEGRQAEAFWAQAVAAAPSLPQAETEWGQSLLRRGDADGAIAKLKSANRKAPHFADPTEAWGEALLAKGDYAGAAARFAEASKYAPHWGRLHLKWAEALARQGKTDLTRAQKQAAAAEDLTLAERAELDGLKV